MESNLEKRKYIFTELHKQHLREAHLGKSSGMKGKTHSDEARAKIAAARTGKKHDEATIEKMRAKRAAYWAKKKGDIQDG